MKSPFSGADTSVDCPGYNHVLHNNLSFRPNRDTLNMGSCNFTYNSFTPGSSVTVDANDFVSTDEALLVAARGSDGSLPVTDFLRLKSTSDLLNKGMSLGFAYNGSAPDFGAFEYKDPTSVSNGSIDENRNALTLISPSGGSNKLLRFSLDQPSWVKIKVLDRLGRMVCQMAPSYFDAGINTSELNLSSLGKGIYLVSVDMEKQRRYVKAAL